MTRPVSAYLLALWDDVRPGTMVTLRRGALTGEKAERTKAWTASGPFYTASGVSCIRVDIGGATVAYPLERVSLGWEEPRPGAGIPFAAVLDPPPIAATLGDRFVSIALAAALLYFMATGGFAFAVWVLR